MNRFQAAQRVAAELRLRDPGHYPGVRAVPGSRTFLDGDAPLVVCEDGPRDWAPAVARDPSMLGRIPGFTMRAVTDCTLAIERQEDRMETSHETRPLPPVAERVRERLLNGGTWLSPDEREIVQSVASLERVSRVGEVRRELVRRALDEISPTDEARAVVTPELVGAVIDVSQNYLDVDGQAAAIEEAIVDLCAVIQYVAKAAAAADCVARRTSSPPPWLGEVAP